MRFNGAQQNGFDRQSAQGEVSAGIRALLLKKTITVSLNAGDIFKTDRWRVVNGVNGTVQDNYFDERRLRLTISWKFGNSKVKPLRDRAIGTD